MELLKKKTTNMTYVAHKNRSNTCKTGMQMHSTDKVKYLYTRVLLKFILIVIN